MSPHSRVGSGRNTPTGLAALALTVLFPVVGTAMDGRHRVRPLTGFDRATVERAVALAERRLATPECSGLLSGLRAADGRTLAESLEAMGTSAAGRLRSLEFADGAAWPGCQGGVAHLLVEAPGSAMVLVCPVFVRGQFRQPTRAASYVIHELLHSAGLGENPPTSESITRRVEDRCGAVR